MHSWTGTTHLHRHSGIRFVTPDQRHSGEAVENCRLRSQVYDLARQRHPRRWSRDTPSWRQPEMVMFNPPPQENTIHPTTLIMAA